MRRWPVGMIGGAPGAFMGDVHRRAMALTGRFELIAANLSRDAKRASKAGADLGLKPERCYEDWQIMASVESHRTDGIALAVIVTPNNMHLPVASAFLEAGIPVLCEKPLTTEMDTARRFAEQFPMPHHKWLWPTLIPAMPWCAKRANS